MILEITPAVVGVSVAALTAVFGGGYYLGDTRWVRRKEWLEDGKALAAERKASAKEIVGAFEEIRLKLEGLDGKFVGRKEWHDERDRQSSIIGKMQLDIRDHETQLAQGSMIMNTLSGNVTTLTATIGSLNIALARMEGMHAASGKGC